jgi:hypothetical protein
MDLGAGTRKFTILDHFPEVMAVEPDLLMVEKSRTSAPRAIIRNCFGRGLYPGTVERRFRLFAALHRMDIPVLARTRGRFSPGLA